jgi:predicted SnoaL-like aldol condensation-catalyzing enzyme
MASSGNVRAAYDKFIAPDFVHHHQYFKGDRQALLIAMEEASKTHPNKSIDIEHLYEDGNVVIAHSLVTPQDPKARGIAVVHILRFESGRVVELWDLSQEIMKDSPNENGMF